MIRHEDWRTRLQDAVNPYYGQPFAWGTRDCALFAADCVLAMTGIDLAEPFRGQYDSKRTARVLLDRLGHASHVDVVAAACPECHPSEARAGDLATVATRQGPAMGVILGAEIGVMGPRGFGCVPLAEAARAFRVGE